MSAFVGVTLLVTGATAAALVAPRLQAAGRGRLIPVLAAPAGAAIGAGAALVRGWGVVGTTVAGAVLVPVLALVARRVELRRRSVGSGGAGGAGGVEERS